MTAVVGAENLFLRKQLPPVWSKYSKSWKSMVERGWNARLWTSSSTEKFCILVSIRHSTAAEEHAPQAAGGKGRTVRNPYADVSQRYVGRRQRFPKTHLQN